MSSDHIHGGPVPPPKLEEIVPGIFAHVQLDGSWGLNNSGVLVGRDTVTLVDTTFTVDRARALAEQLRRVSSNPVRTLINTHHHGDHTYGNFVFPTATIIGSERCRNEMLATGLETTKWFPGVDWGDIQIAPPFVTFDDHLRVYVDDLLLELVFVGPAHTTNDIVVWVPEHRLLFSGDLVFHGGTPFVTMGTVEGSLRALDQLRQFEPRIIVPGHGAVCGPEVLDDQTTYLRFVQQVAREAHAAGESALSAARQTDLGQFSEWLDPERLVGNLHRAFAELSGQPLGAPLNFSAVIADMVEFNGGRPLRCVV